MNQDGFGRTWLTNWKRASETPVRALVSSFVVGSVGAGLGDYYVTSYRNVALSSVIGVVIGAVLTLPVARKLRSYHDD